jgi:hypothetical protein
MEALIAVGLAGNVVSFVQFGREIIREANSIKKGGPSSIEELKRLATHITEQASHLKKRLKGGKATLHQEDQVWKTRAETHSTTTVADLDRTSLILPKTVMPRELSLSLFLMRSFPHQRPLAF